MDSRKICCKVLLWWALLWKNGNVGEWGSRRAISFVGSQLLCYRCVAVRRVCFESSRGIKVGEETHSKKYRIDI